MRTYTFSDGLKVPAGETLAVPSGGIHLDESIYENASVFDGFRFYKIRVSNPGDSDNLWTSCVSTSTEYLSFGHGSHAWFERT